MKKFLPWALALLSTAAVASDIQFNNLTTKDIENVGREFSANFVHTGVSAPETDGVWGIEVGVIGGRSKSPDLSDVIEASGGSGSDFETLYHAAAMARAHFPFDLFAEMTILPEREISEVTIKSNSFEIGWNAGAFFNLPLDLAIGVNRSNSEISFSQTQPVQTDISLESKTTVMWVGVSKTFLFVTPYLKFGAAKSESDFASTVDILVDTNKTKESVDNSGGYLAFGANLQFAFFKIGAEISKVMDVGRASGKISLDF